MKKILTIAFLAIISLTLVACQDKKISETSISVLFFTSPNATQINAYTNLETGQTISEPNDPVRSGYRFEGWYKDVFFLEVWDFNVDVIGEHSLVLYAKWGSGIYSIAYELNGGTMPANFKYLEEYPEDERDPETNPELMKYLFYNVGVNNVLPRPSRVGYVFKNFYTYDEYQWEGATENDESSWKPGDNGYITVPSILARDLILYAHWEANKSSVAFRTNYPGNSGSTVIVRDNLYGSRTLIYGLEFVYQSNFEEGTRVNTLPDFKEFKNGNISYDDLEYEFIGWNDKVDGSGNWFGDGNETHGHEVMTTFSLTYLGRVYGQWRQKNA